VNLLTTTNITEKPSHFGNPSMKFMEMSCHALAGMGKGLNRLGVLQFPEDFAHFLEGSLHPRVTPKARRMKSIYNLGVQS
jgi:hypothetical protein